MIINIDNNVPLRLCLPASAVLGVHVEHQPVGLRQAAVRTRVLLGARVVRGHVFVPRVARGVTLVTNITVVTGLPGVLPQVQLQQLHGLELLLTAGARVHDTEVAAACPIRHVAQKLIFEFELPAAAVAGESRAIGRH